MHALGVLAQHAGGEKTLWDPTILGVLVVMSAVGLFCGSVFLLLGTNLGSRLGFLVSMACLSGFMVLLSSLWIATATPLNSPRGRLAAWSVHEIVDSPTNSVVEAVQNIEREGDVVDAEGLAQLRPALEAALVRHAAEAGEAPPPQEFAEFAKSTDFLTDFEGFKTYRTGGDSKNLLWHEPRYAAVQYCKALPVEIAAGETPPAPRCDPLASTSYAVMKFDFGSQRQPPFIYFTVALLIFGLSLLGLHWYERDEREKRRAALQPVTES